MASKDEKNLAQVIDKIAKMDEPARTLVQRVHEVIVAAEPRLKPRIWYGMPAYALSASAPALVTLRNDERVNLALTEKVELVPAGGFDGTLMPAAWYFETIDAPTEKRIAEIVRSAIS
ncbi:DUF1801 domain-containing protein [Zhihengliuella halotolerans]|uniref:DUF1801 domain-containing protein n=1 Tax=Zhihengliuella halotolerans TaxID=370736 RepID=UPI000C8052E0|nr:DUF1801 domain-containing protein [Zhihengliuella halotolerans]